MALMPLAPKTFASAAFAWLAVCLLPCAAEEPPQPAPVVEVASWWVSKGESASLDVIGRHVERHGMRWQTRRAVGSGTSRYGDVLKGWVAQGNPPMAAQVIGYDIHEWARQGKLVVLDDVAKAQAWDEVVPYGIQNLSKYQGHWVAVPITAHSTNWLWINHAQLARLGLRQPDSWPDLLEMLERAKAAGLIPLAIGREPWEHTLLFESVAASAGGAEFYRRAFLELDPKALDGPLIEQIFQRMSLLRHYLDPGFNGRSWDQATELVSSGQALMQVQGSWIGGEFLSRGLEPGRDYECFRFPDTQGMFLFNADQYMLFKDGPGDARTRAAFAATLMDIGLQRDLNMATGAAPARVDVPRESFDSCGRQSISDLRGANMRRTLMGSIAMGNANPPEAKNAIYEIVSDHFLGRYDDEEAARRLRQAISGARP